MASKFLHNRQASIKKTEPKEPSLKPEHDEPRRTFVDKFSTLPSSLAISKSGLKSKFSLNSFASFKSDSDDHITDADEKAAPITVNDADSEHRTTFEQIEEYNATSFNRRAETEPDGDEKFQKMDSSDTYVDARRDVTHSNTGGIQRMNRRGRGREQSISGAHTSNVHDTRNPFYVTCKEHHRTWIVIFNILVRLH